MEITDIKRLRNVCNEYMLMKQRIRRSLSEIREGTPQPLAISLLSPLLISYKNEICGESSNAYLCALIILFSPQSIFGLPITAGVRRKLAATMNLTGGAISRRVSNVTFYYAQYADFRNRVDSIVEKTKKNLF